MLLAYAPAIAAMASVPALPVRTAIPASLTAVIVRSVTAAMESATGEKTMIIVPRIAAIPIRITTSAVMAIAISATTPMRTAHIVRMTVAT